MNSLRDLLSEYDQLGEVAFSSAHDFTLRQRKLEDWANKARNAIEELVVHGQELPERNVVASDLKRTGS